MNCCQNNPVSRRNALQTGTSALGSIAATALLGSRVSANAGVTSGIQSPLTHHVQRSRRVIMLFMNGGPSQLDMFDHKPELSLRHGSEGQRKNQKLFGSPWSFRQRGQSGIWMSELLPHLAAQADRLCVINSMQTDSSAHPLAIPLLHTGSFQFTRPSVGSWVLYGLGTQAHDIPGFVTINPTRTFGGPSNYGSAFLPSEFQATRIGFQGRSLKDVKINNVSRPDLPADARRQQLDLTQQMNASLLARTQQAAAVEGVLDSLALSGRMQSALPRVMDLSQESAETLSHYGIDQKRSDNFGRQCLLARRFIEAGTRFVELSSHGWDHHSNLGNLERKCQEVDKPMAALLADLAQRGLLDDTLVMWIGEFGRQPDSQLLEGQTKPGRDHNARGYTAWLAGGGVRGGLQYGTTDELGYAAVENPVHLYDLHATVLHLLGLDHTRLTYRYAGRDFRLTDVHGSVVNNLIA